MIFNTPSCSSLAWKCASFMEDRPIFGSMLPIDGSRPLIKCGWSTDLPNSVDWFHVHFNNIQQRKWRPVVTPFQLLNSNCLIQLPMSWTKSWHDFMWNSPWHSFSQLSRKMDRQDPAMAKDALAEIFTISHDRLSEIPQQSFTISWQKIVFVSWMYQQKTAS